MELKPQTLGKAVEDLESLIGAESNFFRSTVDAPDWEFVVKIHTLLEPAITHQVTSELGREELRPFVARLDMSSDVISKLALVKHLGLLTSEDRSFIRFMSEIRNQLIHNVRTHPFKLDKYVSELKGDKRSQYEGCVAPSDTDPPGLQKYKSERETYVRTAPKHAMWIRAIAVLYQIYIHHKKRGKSSSDKAHE